MDAVSANRLLANLSIGDSDLIAPYLNQFELVHGAVLAEAGDSLMNAYFPNSGIISLVARLAHGATTEVAMVGRDSLFGGSGAFGSTTALTTAIVQSAGTCSILPIGRLHDAADHSKTFSDILVRHEQAIFVQAQQSAACNASHAAISRLARWLLRARDAYGSDHLHFTQEFLAQMLGVQRNAVSLVAGTLQKKELIRVSRANIHIIDVDGLKDIACECFETVRNQLDELKRSKKML